MEATHVTVERDEAERLYRKYKEHQAYSSPIDWEIQRTYQLLAQGKVVIKAIESVVKSGVDEKGLPKLALGRATLKEVHLQRNVDGSGLMTSTTGWRQPKRDTFNYRADTFTFPTETFPMRTWGAGGREPVSWPRAQVPLIPIHLRPRRALQNYHILWEAEWQPIPPRDPYLLRRIGDADLWLVVAHWDLTEVERGALATRVAPH